jgi:hypothetical protein
MDTLPIMRPSRIPRLSRSGKTAEVTYVSRRSVLCGGSKPRWGLEVATQAVKERLHAWQQADEEKYMRSLEEIGEHMQEFYSCMTEYDRIDLALEKLANFEEAGLRGSTVQDCNLEEELRQVEMSAEQVMTEQEALLKISHFAEAVANELLRPDAYNVEHAVDKAVIEQDKVEPVEKSVAVRVQEEASEATETTPSEGLEECLQINDDKVFDGNTVANVNETVEKSMLSENKPCQDAARSDGVDSTDASQHRQGLKWLQGKLLHYSELKEDLVELVKVYKEQINAAQYHLQDCW